MKNYKYQFVLTATILALCLAACKKPSYDADFDLPRQFKPGDINVSAGEIEAKLSWDASLFTVGKGVTYTVQVDDDSLFQGTLVYNNVVDTTVVVLTDNELVVGQAYFARIKANANGPTAESGWVVSDSFKITGEQIFAAVLDADLTDSSVLLKWRPSAGLTKITLTPAAGGTPIDVPLTTADVAANQKLVKGLAQLTTYNAVIYRNTTEKGKISFTTKEKSIFTLILSPGDDLIAAVNNAANGDVIGLQAGTYSLNPGGSYSNLEVVGKTVTIQSFTNDPSTTTINFKEIKLKGSGAGIILRGITFLGTPGNADYFLNLAGQNADADAATFTKIIVDNSVVKGTNNSLIRGNRGGNNAHKIDSIQLKNSIFADNGSSGGFDYILLDKMEFNALDINSSTFYNSGRRLISWATNITAPRPKITIDKVTINSIGYLGRDNVLLDANGNNVEFSVRNSIIGNTPKPGQTVGGSLLRASNASATVSIANSNLFNLITDPTANPVVALTIPAYVSKQNLLAVDLGWTGATTSFNLPAGSPLLTASETGGPIGDPRWW